MRYRLLACISVERQAVLNDRLGGLDADLLPLVLADEVVVPEGRAERAIGYVFLWRSVVSRSAAVPAACREPELVVQEPLGCPGQHRVGE